MRKSTPVSALFGNNTTSCSPLLKPLFGSLASALKGLEGVGHKRCKFQKVLLNEFEASKIWMMHQFKPIVLKVVLCTAC